MIQKCSSCNHVTNTRKFGKKYYCRFCSDTNLGNHVEIPKDFNIHHLAEAVGQIANLLHERISKLEDKAKIENEKPILNPRLVKEKLNEK